MNQKKKPGEAGTNNRARFTSLRIILADKRFRDKFYLAIMRGSVAGGVLAAIIGVLYMETSILEGLIIAGAGIAWLGVFYLINPDDVMFGG